MAQNDQEIVLITGGNTGVGLEIARLLLREHGSRFHVLIGCRTVSKGEAAVKELHGQGLASCEVIEIQVTDDDSITRAVEEVSLKFGRLDILHVNAGIAPDKDMLPAGEPISKIIRETFNTNVAGAAQTAEAFSPLLSKGNNPRIIFMSSGFGSLSRVSTFQSNKDWPAYSSSKAALNMIMIWFVRRFPDWKINACCPGFRGTALNNFGQGAPDGRKPGKLEDGAKNAVRLSLLGKDGETGTFTQRNDETGEAVTLPW